MKVEVKSAISAIDAQACDDTIIKPGTYELEEVKNPYETRPRTSSIKWLVIKGTCTGMPIPE